jgi:hypothetical protein
MRILHLVGFSLLSPLLTPVALANDAVSSVTLKRIEFSKTDKIAMREERLVITPKKLKSTTSLKTPPRRTNPF